MTNKIMASQGILHTSGSIKKASKEIHKEFSLPKSYKYRIITAYLKCWDTKNLVLYTALTFRIISVQLVPTFLTGDLHLKMVFSATALYSSDNCTFSVPLPLFYLKFTATWLTGVTCLQLHASFPPSSQTYALYPVSIAMYLSQNHCNPTCILNLYLYQLANIDSSGISCV